MSCISVVGNEYTFYKSKFGYGRRTPNYVDDVPFGKEIEFANLKVECAYKLAEKINNREIKIICTDEQKVKIIEELAILKADSVDKDESKKRIIKKEIMKELLGRSPDYLDMLLMGMYFEVQYEEPECFVYRG